VAGWEIGGLENLEVVQTIGRLPNKELLLTG
jgi:hypothetical protein